MKKIINKIRTSFIILSTIALPQIVNAQVNLEKVFTKYRINGNTEYSEINNTANLPDADSVDLIIEIIKIILRISGILTFLALTVGGIMYIISRGEGDGTMLENAKKTMIWSIVGVLIIMVAFAIVYGITTIKF